MKTFLTIIATIIVTSIAFLIIAQRHPAWLIKLEYDKNGFPRLRFKGDKFILKNKLYIFDGNIWVEQFPIDAKEGDTYTKNDGTTYVFHNGVWTTSGGNGGDGNSNERINVNIGLISKLPISTIDEINAMNPNVRMNCVAHSYTVTINGNSYSGVYYTYGQFEVSKSDCQSHGAL